jgi:ZIP family zinc transporter
MQRRSRVGAAAPATVSGPEARRGPGAMAATELPARGEIGLATLLVVGFALHNGTEGFGIVAPLAADQARPGWSFLLALGLIGGGPTVLGTLIGHQFDSDVLSVAFLTLAGSSSGSVGPEGIGSGSAGVLLRLAVGFITDMIVTAGGA